MTKSIPPRLLARSSIDIVQPDFALWPSRGARALAAAFLLGLQRLRLRGGRAGIAMVLLLAFVAQASAHLSITTTALPSATAGTPYAFTLTAGGGTPPYAWSDGGGLPTGLNLSSAGVITGNAQGAAWIYSYPFRDYITVTDSAKLSSSVALNIAVLPPGSTPPPATPTNSPPAQTNSSPATTDYTLTVVNGAGGGSFAAGATVAITANPAPSGQTFSKWTGATVANALAPGTTLVMPAASANVTANYAPLVPPLQITTKALSNAVGGVPYSQTLTAAGGTPPYTWTLTSGGLAPGLNLAANGQITGTPQQAAWIYAYPDLAYITVADSANASVSASFGMSTLAPPAPPAPTYALTVVNGSGGGNYPAGAVQPITAGTPPAGQVFLSWSGATVANPNSASTTLTMPAAPVTVTANFTTPVPTYPLVVNNGAGGGNYAAGAVVNITANAAPSGQVFKNWTGATVANPSAVSTTLVMPASATNVTANFGPIVPPLQITTTTLSNATGGVPYSQTLTAAGGTPPYAWTITSGGLAPGLNLAANGQITGTPQQAAWIYASPDLAYITVTDSVGASTSATLSMTVLAPPVPTFPLTVVNGSGSSNYAASAVVTITADAPPAGQVFLSWSGAVVANASSATTTLTMPAGPVTVTANFGAPVPTFSLVVNGGTGSGNYAAGAQVGISANPPPAGQAFLDWTGAAVLNASSANTTLVMPAGAASVTANYGVPVPTYSLTVVNGSGSGSYPTGSVVTITANPPPAGKSFADWTGSDVANQILATTTITLSSGNAFVTANYSSTPPGPVPFPVTSHPRLWVTPADLPRLQSWANPTNAVYQQGLRVLLGRALGNYYTAYFPGGAANTNYPDLGDTQGYQGCVSEDDAMILAFNSLIDPNPTNRMLYAQCAHDILMYALNQAALGVLAGAPFRDPLFPTYNRANASGQSWGLAVDWIYNATNSQGNPILTAADKQIIQKVFMIWANECLSADTTGGDHPSPIGVMNNSQLLPGNSAYRMAANNYYLGHARLLTMMALSLDPADDPPVDPSQPSYALGNSLRSFINEATGAWLYQEFAMFGDPEMVASAYGLPPGTSVGIASGGLPPEGMLYGHSFAFSLGQLLALQTAGFNNTNFAGPQIAMIGAPMWDRFVTGFISSLAPVQRVEPSMAYLGPVYQMASYGDLLRLWITPDFVQPFALLALLEGENGQTNHLNEARWFALNALQGGAQGLISRITDPYNVIEGVLNYMLFDPTAPGPADPRPSYPTAFYDAPAGRMLSRTDWTPNATMFDYRCSWISINHQDGDGGQFEFYRKGEWLTKEMSNYDSNGKGQASDYHNSLTIGHTAPDGAPQVSWFEDYYAVAGSQWNLGDNAGDPTTYASVGTNYTFCFGDITSLYNRPDVWEPTNTVTNTSLASRSVLWLDADYIVVYDHAATFDTGEFKRFHLNTINPPVINGNVATATTPGGQNLFVQTLLPLNPSETWAETATNLSFVAWLEPTSYTLAIEDPAQPLECTFLHVLQGADPGAPMVPAAYVTSTAGTSFDGAVFANKGVFFASTTGAAFTGTTLVVPTGVNEVFVAGLGPATSYGVVTQSVAGGTQITITPGGVNGTTDTAGVLSLNY